MAKITDEKLLILVREFVTGKFSTYKEAIPIECKTCGLPDGEKISITDGKGTISLTPQAVIEQIEKFLTDNYSVEIIEFRIKQNV